MKYSVDQIIGAWELTKYELISPGEQPRPLWSEIRGSLVYTADGIVSVLIVKMGVDELKNSEVIAYSGKFQIDGDRLIHKVYVSNIYRYIENSIDRTIEFNKDILILTTNELVKGAIHRVSWKRSIFES